MTVNENCSGNESCPGNRQRTGLDRPLVVIPAVVAASALAVLAARLAGWVSWAGVVQILLAVAAGAILVTVVVWRRWPSRAWRALCRVLFGGRYVDESDHRYWFVPVALCCALGAFVLVVVAVMALWDLDIGDVLPWLAVIAAVMLLVVALMAISYAPPGPNWVERISRIEGRVILAMAGIAIVVFATLQYFDFGVDGEAPSDWWLAVAAIGLLLVLSSIGRPPSRPRREPGTPPRPTAGDARAAALTTYAAADDARSAHDEIRRLRSGTQSEPRVVRAERAAADAAARAGERAAAADHAAVHARELERGLAAEVAAARRNAAEASAASVAARAAMEQAAEACGQRDEDADRPDGEHIEQHDDPGDDEEDGS